MNALEFKELQEEFADFVYRIESFNKKGFILDLKYSTTYHDILVENHRLEMETGLLDSVLRMKANNESEENITRFINKVKSDFEKKKEQIVSKYNYGIRILEKYENIPAETMEEFEAYYKEYLLVYYPPVRVLAPKSVKPIIEIFSKLYVENNYGAFKEILELNREKLNFPEIPEDKYNMVAQYYYNYKIQANKDYMDKKGKYPYTKSSIFRDEMSMKAEEGELLIHQKTIMKMNKAIHLDYVNIMGEDLFL